LHKRLIEKMSEKKFFPFCTSHALIEISRALARGDLERRNVEPAAKAVPNVSAACGSHETPAARAPSNQDSTKKPKTSTTLPSLPV
jgi:hypothetical protein